MNEEGRQLGRYVMSALRAAGIILLSLGGLCACSNVMFRDLIGDDPTTWYWAAALVGPGIVMLGLSAGLRRRLARPDAEPD